MRGDGDKAEAVAILLEWSVVRMAVKSVASAAADDLAGSKDLAAPAENGPALPPPGDKVGAEIQQDVGVPPVPVGLRDYIVSR